MNKLDLSKLTWLYAEDGTVYAVTYRCAHLTRLWWAEETSRRANVDTFYDLERQDTASLENTPVTSLPCKRGHKLQNAGNQIKKYCGVVRKLANVGWFWPC